MPRPRGATAISALLDAMPDPVAVDEHWRRICRDMVAATAASEYERGQADGYLRAVADFKAFQHTEVRDAELERLRWRVCCRRCRLEGRRDNCPDCEDRSRETCSQPHSADRRTGEIQERARSSWAPYGLGPPGMVHLGGRPVHHHACGAACDAYEPGWYTPEAAAAILVTLPGGYAAAVTALRVASANGRRSAA